MRTLFLGTVALLCMGANAAFGLNIVIMVPANQGPIFPGDTVGWDFTLTPDLFDYIEIQTVSVDESPSLGLFTDFLELYAPFAPGNAGVFYAFDPLTSGGVGTYAIDHGTVFSASTTLQFTITYDLYPCDHSLGQVCSAVDGGSGLTLYDDLGNLPQVTFQLADQPADQTGDQVPEPATAPLFAGVLFVGIAAWLRRESCRPKMGHS